MKFIILTCLISLILANSALALKTKAKLRSHFLSTADGEEEAKSSDTKVAILGNHLQKLWETIFKENERKTCGFGGRKASVIPITSKELQKKQALGHPFPRENYYGKLNIGMDRSAYFFDYLDELLREDFIKYFDKIIKDVKKNPQDDPKYFDPYSISKILNLPKEMSPPQTKEDLYDRMKIINPTFDADFWEGSFNAVQIAKAIEDNHWDFPIGTADPAKRMIDRFDFSGDGRLSADELIIAVIDTNKNIIGEKKCKNCLEEIIFDKIDPMYTFADCDNNDKLSAEEIWRSFRYLKRNTKKYNIYLCEYDGDGARTGAINDFLLKSQRSDSGNLTKREFSLGILVGYWTRQMDNGVLIKDDLKSRRMERWADPSGIDNECVNQ